MKIEHATHRSLPWVNRAHVATITDLPTGLRYNILGENNAARHLDYVCATRSDMEIKLRTADGNFNGNWAARPCILTIGGRHFAAATHNAAHAPDVIGYVTLRNAGHTVYSVGHTGHFCVFVREAQTGGSATYRRNMLAAVERAYILAQNFNFVSAAKGVRRAGSAQGRGGFGSVRRLP